MYKNKLILLSSFLIGLGLSACADNIITQPNPEPTREPAPAPYIAPVPPLSNTINLESNDNSKEKASVQKEVKAGPGPRS
ncbi:MAG: hypothetical protein K1X44_05975 [Alphaproteobacteria bacterium]|nr:hypothetical protein [Alphaproteobacteria bacterium]